MPSVKLPAVMQLRPYQQRWIDDASRFQLMVKGARIGITFGSMTKACLDCVERPNTTWTVLGAAKAQAIEAMEAAHKIRQLMGFTAEVYEEPFADALGISSESQTRMQLANGARIIALPANPRTARGYPGNVILTEHAHFQNAYAIWAAVARQVALGHRLLSESTPNGEIGKFFDLARDLGLTDGVPPPGGHVQKGAWSGHWVDINMAVADGCPISIAEMRDLFKDDETFSQEFLCAFLKVTGAWLSLELILGCEDEFATTELPPNFKPRGLLYGGMDVARDRNQTVFWMNERIGEITMTRLVLPIASMGFVQQAEILSPLIAMTACTAMDSTGMGIGLFDILNEKHSGRLMGVNFGGSSRLRREEQQEARQGQSVSDGPVRMKVDLSIRFKRALESGHYRIPADPEIRLEFQSIKKQPTATGVTFDAPQIQVDTAIAGGERKKIYAHADRYWAAALADYAARVSPLELGMTTPEAEVSFQQSRGYL